MRGTGHDDCFLLWKTPPHPPTPDLPERYKGVCTMTPTALMDKLRQAEKGEKPASNGNHISQFPAQGALLPPGCRTQPS